MARKKWFGIAAVTAAASAVAAYGLTKIRQSPEGAAEMDEGVKATAKEGPEKAAAIDDAANEKLQRSDETAEAELETAAP